MKKIRLLSGLTIALAPIATSCSHKDVVVVYNPIPFTSEFYSMNDSGGNRVKINGFSEMVIDNPAILSKYNEIKITDYKNFKTI